MSTIITDEMKKNVEYQFIAFVRKSLFHTRMKFYTRQQKYYSVVEVNFDELEQLEDANSNVELMFDLDYLSNCFDEIFTDKAIYQRSKFLTQKEKSVLYLTIVKDLKEKEIAKETNVCRQSINNLRRKALRKLRNGHA